MAFIYALISVAAMAGGAAAEANSNDARCGFGYEGNIKGECVPVAQTIPPPEAFRCPSGEIVTAKVACPSPEQKPVPAYGVQCADDRWVPQARECPENYPPRPTLARSAVPRSNPANWVTSEDYPPLALMNQWEGTTGFRLDIGEDGRVTDCQITSSSGYGLMDEATCMHIKRRARFTPATDLNGKIISGRYSNRVNWRLPFDDPAPANPPVSWKDANQRGAMSHRGPNKAPDPIGMQMWLSHEPYWSKHRAMPSRSFSVVVGKDGRVTKCEAIDPADAKLPNANADLCKELKAHATFHPATDANGYISTGRFGASTRLLRTLVPTVKR